jgi:hypothetical protein
MPAVIMKARRTYTAGLALRSIVHRGTNLTPAPATPASDIAVAGALRHNDELNMVAVPLNQVVSPGRPPEAAREQDMWKRRSSPFLVLN